VQVGMSPADLKLRVVYLLCESIKVHNTCSTGIICVVPPTNTVRIVCLRVEI
jgi:hypothetical protein